MHTEQIEPDIEFYKVTSEEEYPSWTSKPEIIDFFHHTMKPYHDKPEDIQRALDYAFSDSEGEGGFLMLTKVNGKLGGALLMLNSGMKGYIPENILLFVTVDPSLRGKGIGGKLIKRCIDECYGDVKLHIEYDNPAKRLYERIGFTNKYAEMRYIK
ncbi:GNAT family N-acetyltransferase [bacterium]|nr:GNAT family N-acetyltransferase [bacterium]